MKYLEYFYVDYLQHVSYRGPQPETPEEAFEISLAKYRFILDHIEEIVFDGGVSTCGLCMYFWRKMEVNWTVYPCVRRSRDGLDERCPIMLHTGRSTCAGTPYQEFLDALRIGWIEQARIQARLEYDLIEKLYREYKEYANE